jgi:hypothetical protein
MRYGESGGLHAKTRRYVTNRRGGLLTGRAVGRDDGRMSDYGAGEGRDARAVQFERLPPRSRFMAGPSGEKAPGSNVFT